MPISSLLTERSLIDFMMSLRRLLVAEALQGQGEMPLRLAVGQLQPVLACLAQEVIDGFLVLLGDRLVGEEEAAAIEIQGYRRSTGGCRPCRAAV